MHNLSERNENPPPPLQKKKWKSQMLATKEMDKSLKSNDGREVKLIDLAICM